MSERQEFTSNTCETCIKYTKNGRYCYHHHLEHKACKDMFDWKPTAWFTALQAAKDENAALTEKLESVLYIWRSYDEMPSTTDEQMDKKDRTLHELFGELKRVDES